MNNTRHLPIIIISFLILFLVSCSANNQNLSGKENSREIPNNAKPTAEKILSDLETELSMVLKTSRGISSERYNEITERIKELEAKGASPDKINRINNLLSQFEVGGMKEESPKNNIPENTDSKFESIKNEIAEIKAKGMPLSVEHSDRLSHELNYFKQQGHSLNEIEELLQIVLKLSPHIQDNLKEQDEQKNPKFEWIPPSTCSGDKIVFTKSPVDLDEILYIVPMGQIAADHVTPTDHGYIINSKRSSPEISNLYSPADGYILSIGAFPRPNDFRIVLWHSCAVSTIYIHVNEIAPEILKITGEIPPSGNWKGDEGPQDNRIPPIPVKAGQLIGKIKGGVDFSVHDTSVNLGFVNASLYNPEPWKIHTADLFEYFDEPLKSQLKEKGLRDVEPVGGKIDYDIDGKLVGNWFIEGTDYSGKGASCTYFECHLAIAYDNIFPDLIRIAVPNSGINKEECNACFGVYGVKGNKPNPAEISMENGLVKYEIVAIGHIEHPEFGTVYSKNIESQMLGVFLVQMLGNRRIKIEVFPEKNANEVIGFTDNARIYER